MLEIFTESDSFPPFFFAVEWYVEMEIWSEHGQHDPIIYPYYYSLSLSVLEFLGLGCFVCIEDCCGFSGICGISFAFAANTSLYLCVSTEISLLFCVPVQRWRVKLLQRPVSSTKRIKF